MTTHDAKLITSIASDARLAQIPGVTRESLQKQLAAVLENPQGLSQRSFEIGTPEASGDCVKIPFGLSFFDVIELGGHIEACRGACWKAEVSAYLKILGNEIARRTVTIDCNGAETTLIDFGIEGLAWIKVAVGARGENVCFYLRGHASFLWYREDFDETLFCLVPLPAVAA